MGAGGELAKEAQRRQREEGPAEEEGSSSLMSERVELATGETAREECGDIYYPDPLTEEEDNNDSFAEEEEEPELGASAWIWEMIQSQQRAARREHTQVEGSARNESGGNSNDEDGIPVIGEEDVGAARRLCTLSLNAAHDCKNGELING